MKYVYLNIVLFRGLFVESLIICVRSGYLCYALYNKPYRKY